MHQSEHGQEGSELSRVGSRSSARLYTLVSGCKPIALEGS